MKIKKIIYILIAVIVLTVCIGSSFFREVENVEAATRLNGIQQIVEEINAEDPYIILELVPDEAYASIGAFVKGAEPDIDPKLLADCATEDDRRGKVMRLLGEVAENGSTYPLSYEYDTLYEEQVSAPADMNRWHELALASVQTEERTGHYEAVAEGETGDYTAIPVTDDTDNVSDEDVVTVSDGDAVTVSDGDAGPETPEEVTTYTYTYTPGAGTHRWVDAPGEETYEVSFDKVYYRVNITSNEWFAQKVFECTPEENVANSIKVISLTPAQLEANIIQGYLARPDENLVVRDWSDVDLLYISNSTCLSMWPADKALFDTYVMTGENGEYINDISSQVAYIIYEYVFNTSLPVIVDSSLTSLASALDDTSTNLQKLAYLLWDYTTDMTPNSYKNGDAVIDLSTWTTQWPAGLSELLVSNVSRKYMGAYGNVQGSVYIVNGANIVNPEYRYTITSVPFETATFDGIYTEQEAILRGVSAVVNEIESENFYNKLNGIGYTAEYNEARSKIDISQNAVVRYILNYANRRPMLYKDTIKVLDIEPTKYSTLTEEKIRGWLKAVDANRIKKIEIKQMTSAEFIGTLDDLTAEYDMIYIGGELGPSMAYGAMNQVDGETVFNDETMNGLVYFHVGDTYTSERKYKGLLDTEYNSAKTQYTSGNIVTRLSGNDITRDKLRELKEYIDAGYPIVLSSKFSATDSSGRLKVNSDRVDNSSFMYELFNYGLPKDNVMFDNLRNSSLFANYLNMSRLYLSMISVPVEYAVTYDDSGEIDTVQFLPENNGKYTLEYIFELSNNAGVNYDSIAYMAQIYIDTNADGRYDPSEELDSLNVYDVATNQPVPFNRLKTGVRYKLSRELPMGFVGMLPWKLEITQVKVTEGAADEISKIHTNVNGYTAVPAKETTEINVLYIHSDRSACLKFSNDTFTGLFDNVKDKFEYDIKFTNITVDDYVSKYKKHLKDHGLSDNEAGYTHFYNSELNYDMIMMGFIDVYDDIESNGATMALKLFIESGRSLLFSHDNTSFVNANKTIYQNSGNNTYWGYYLNKNIRSIVGMDRYGVTETTLPFLKAGNDLNLEANPSQKTAIDGLGKDLAYKVGSGRTQTYKEVHGYNDVLIMVQDLKSEYEKVYMTDVVNGETVNYVDGLNDRNRTTAISQINKGQITTFPYDINLDDSHANNVSAKSYNGKEYQVFDPTTMEIMRTHYQYYQLDFNLDKTGDGNSDIVVWYCLSDQFYDAVPNDVRNSYYIYSVGNVMYTGMGHSGNNVSLEEAKLMINTIIASYKAGKRNPQVSIVKNETNKGATKEYSYRTYDDELGLVDNENEVIYFYVNDNNIISGQKRIDLKYYVEIEPELGEVYDETNPAHVLTSVGGEEVYLRELTYGKGSSDELVDAYFTIENNSIGRFIVKPKLLADRFADQDISSVKLYVSAQTTLDYDGGQKDEKTGVVYACLTVKIRDLFDLD